jgi:hypothetical protein
MAIDLTPLVDTGGLAALHTARAEFVGTGSPTAQTQLLQRLNATLPTGAMAAHVGDAVTVDFNPDRVEVSELQRWLDGIRAETNKIHP